MSAVAAKLPPWLRAALGPLRKTLLATAYHGRARLCPVCGRSSRRFRAYGRPPRKEAECVHCGALERHRLLWLFLDRTDLFDGRPRTMLHVAPEKCLEARFRERLGPGYLTADLHDPNATVRIDITRIDYPDESFDVIYCGHVLEHVPDDRKAMAELHRVLRSTGWAILTVPITAGKTFEDPAIVDPAERRKAFGQDDHVRRYGPDYVERLRDAGFSVTVVNARDLLTGQDPRRLGLTAVTGDIYLCTR